MAESQELQGSAAQVSEAQIAVHWREEKTYPPPPSFVEQAHHPPEPPRPGPASR